MPFTIHEEAAKKQMSVNVMRPQEQVPERLPQNFSGTLSQGLPVKQIPVYHFPRVVYMHPNESTMVIEHRNDKHELVEEEIVPTEHLTKVVACDAHLSNPVEKCMDCDRALKAALAEGWVLEPYLPKPVPKRNAGLYGPRKKSN